VEFTATSKEIRDFASNFAAPENKSSTYEK